MYLTEGAKMNSLHELKKIVIVGGGSAGWMSAMILADTLKEKNIEIELLESPIVGVIGVGEGSTPALKRFFDSLQIPESEWMPECNATYKCGITFDGWSTKPGFTSYFHQFASMVDNITQPLFISNVHARLQGMDVNAKPNDYFLTSVLVEKNLAPIPSENFPFTTSYGYHFDATLLGRFLQKKALERGVRFTPCHIEHASLNEHGDIDAVITRDGLRITADLFVDCSGFSSLLIEKTLKTPFVSYTDNLYNDSAIALPTEIGSVIPSQTLSTAMKFGWAWKIPLTNRFGNGYVYSSQFCSSDEAETELREKLGLLDADVSPRHLKMKVGRVEKHWNKNCVAVGLSQGFLEPLEATALYLTQMTIAIFALFLERGDYSEQARAAYNNEINNFFDGHRDYIVAHYKTNSRTDTEFWKANARNLDRVSESLGRLFEVWLHGKDLSVEIRRQDIERYYPIGSWYALMAGMGIFPEASASASDMSSVHAGQGAQMKDFLQRCALNYRDHRTVLEQAAQG